MASLTLMQKLVICVTRSKH